MQGAPLKAGGAFPLETRGTYGREGARRAPLQKVGMPTTSR
jgi:hypothetical protein